MEFHRKSIRLKEYDYAQPDGYFITIVTMWREFVFGEIVGEEMHLFALGRIAEECWREIPAHFPNVELGAFIIMPNHVHGIVIITENDWADAFASARKGTIYRAPTPTFEQFGKPTIGSLPTIIRIYKAAVTRRAGRELNAASIWQRNYYEHVIRNNAEWDKIHRYIQSNPSMWAEDEENPAIPRKEHL